MRNAGRLKLGYYPLPIDEAQNIRALLVPSGPYAAIDPCLGDGTALIEITEDSGACPAGIELDADRAAAATTKGISTVHGSAFDCVCWQKPARFCISTRPMTASSDHTVIRGWSWCSWNIVIAG